MASVTYMFLSSYDYTDFYENQIYMHLSVILFTLEVQNHHLYIGSDEHLDCPSGRILLLSGPGSCFQNDVFPSRERMKKIIFSYRNKCLSGHLVLDIWFHPTCCCLENVLGFK